MRYVKIGLRILLGLLMITAGIAHFRTPDFFIKIMPPYIPWHAEIVAITGAMEIGFGIALFIPQVAHLAGWALIAFFIAVFPANIHLYLHQDIMPDVSPAMQLIRLPLQGVLILWAFWFTRRSRPAASEINPDWEQTH